MYIYFTKDDHLDLKYAYIAYMKNSTKNVALSKKLFLGKWTVRHYYWKIRLKNK